MLLAGRLRRCPLPTWLAMSSSVLSAFSTSFLSLPAISA